MKTNLQNHLRAFAPSVSIVTLWEHDPTADFQELTGPGDAFENEDPMEWQAWQSEVKATAIEQGAELTGSDYMGGTWERYGDNPEESNPEISGYENQMTIAALEELAAQVTDTVTLGQIRAAIAECKRLARESYEAQRREIEAARA